MAHVDFIVAPTSTGTRTGSEANPFLPTDLNAMIAAGGGTACADTTFLFNDGTWNVADNGDQNCWIPLRGGGLPGLPLVIKSRNPRGAKLRGAASGTRFQIFKSVIGTPCNYLEISDFDLHGGGGALGSSGPFGAVNLFVQFPTGAFNHHLTFKNNRVVGTQGTGFDLDQVDYVTCIENVGWKNGKRLSGDPISASSFISLNAKGAPYFFDTASGFHSIVARCKGAGQVSGAGGADGNFFINDNGGSATDFLAPSILVIHCLAYGNGGRGFHNLRQHATEGIWFMLNTSAWNGLDQSALTQINGNGAEFDSDKGEVYLVGNVAQASAGTGNFGTTAYRDASVGATTYHLFNNYKQTAGRTSGAMTGGAGLIDTLADLGWLTAPTIDTAANDPYLSPDPETIGVSFVPKLTSALRDTVPDPRAIAAMSDTQRAQLADYLAIDLQGLSAPR